jgi:MSHA pilin protein MshD
LSADSGWKDREHGLSLVELIVAIVVISAAVAGVLSAINMATRASVDPMIQKQALSIAEAVLEEIQLMPFTYCDPDDPQAGTALSAAVGATGCTAAASVEGLGPESTAPYGPETRLGGTTPFDNVNDYNGFTMTGIISSSGSVIAGLESYVVSVAVAGQALGPGAVPPLNIPSAASQLITVNVTWPSTGIPKVAVALHGYRVRFAPNAIP